MGITGRYKRFLSSSLSGQVIDENNKPVSSAKVSVGDKDAQTNTDGQFSLDSVVSSTQKLAFLQLSIFCLRTN